MTPQPELRTKTGPRFSLLYYLAVCSYSACQMTTAQRMLVQVWGGMPHGLKRAHPLAPLGLAPSTQP